MKGKTTPRPWVLLPEEADKDYLRIRGTALGGKYKIANVDIFRQDKFDEGPANAELIVRAVNSHEALIEAVNALLICIDGLSDQAFRVYNALEVKQRARAALALAGEQL